MAAMPAAALMILATLLFATMGVTVKLASALYSTGEIVFYRGLVGAITMALLAALQCPACTSAAASPAWQP
jgi:S-adenosylmethionine uptake transporter